MTRSEHWRRLRTFGLAACFLGAYSCGRAADPRTTEAVPRSTTSAGTASPLPSMPWTVPPQSNTLFEPRLGEAAALPPSSDSAGEPRKAIPKIDFDDLAPAGVKSLRFAGRNEAMLDGDAKGIRQREGAQIVERRGRFEVHGDRVIFFAEEPDAHYVVLENLALERVTRVVEESGPQLVWSVTGTLSEYRSLNYLMISRAVVKSAQGPVEPGRLADPTARALPVGPNLGIPPISPTLGPAAATSRSNVR